MGRDHRGGHCAVGAALFWPCCVVCGFVFVGRLDGWMDGWMPGPLRGAVCGLFWPCCGVEPPDSTYTNQFTNQLTSQPTNEPTNRPTTHPTDHPLHNTRLGQRSGALATPARKVVVIEGTEFVIDPRYEVTR